MDNKSFKDLLKKYDAKKILAMHCNLSIKLNNKQIEKIIDLKNKK